MDLLKIDSFITYETVEHVSIVSHISLVSLDCQNVNQNDPKKSVAYLLAHSLSHHYI